MTNLLFLIIIVLLIGFLFGFIAGYNMGMNEMVKSLIIKPKPPTKKKPKLTIIKGGNNG